MALNTIAGFHIGGTEPIDDKFLLSKAQMLVFDDNIAPQSFLCCCTDDNKVYQYIKTNTVDSVTGKFRVFEDVVFFNLPAEDDWEDENVTRPFYNQLKSAIDNGKFIVVTEKLSGDFDSWVYYTVAYNSVDSSEEDQEWINLTSFDGIYVDVLEIHPVNISKTETEMKGEVIVELDKTDIRSVYEELFDISEETTPVLHEKVGRADYYWKFINDEEDESIGSVTGYIFLCSKNGELHKLVVSNNFYQETILSNQASTMPTANAYNLGQIIQYTGTTTSDYTNGFFYKCTESSGTYSWETVNVQSGGGSGGDKVQYDTLPTNPTFGQIIQWVGTTSTDLINGRFYRYEANSVTWMELFNYYFGTNLNIKEGMSFIYNGHSIVRIEYAIEDDGATCVLHDSDDTEIAFITKSDPADFSILELDPVYIPSGSWIEVDMGSKDISLLKKTINSNWQGNGYNLLPFLYKDSSKTVNGITFTVNADGSITANGTATTTTWFNVIEHDDMPNLEIGKTYRLSGCPSGGGTATYFLKPRNAGGSEYDTGNGYIFTHSADIDDYLITIRFQSGVVCNNVVFKPMLVEVDSNGNYPTEYQRYALGNTELTDKINSAVIPVNPTITPTTEGAMWIEIV